jgi:hypothetical protein
MSDARCAECGQLGPLGFLLVDLASANPGYERLPTLLCRLSACPQRPPEKRR